MKRSVNVITISLLILSNSSLRQQTNIKQKQTKGRQFEKESLPKNTTIAGLYIVQNTMVGGGGRVGWKWPLGKK